MNDRASILAVADEDDRLFVSPRSLAALLSLEGVNDVDAIALSALDDAALAGRSLVLLGPADPAPEVVERLVSFVQNGGGLVALAPGEALAPKLGLAPRNRGARDARWDIDGLGIVPLIVRGWTQFYSAAPGVEGVTLGRIVTGAGVAGGFAPLIETRMGRGRVVTLAADVVQAVCVSRQGDPSLAGARTTGYTRMRPSDLFEGVDNADCEQPTADLLCHLLREALHRAWPGGTALPWLWYFPGNADTVAALTSDDDWGKREEFEKLIACCDRHGARLTFYLTQPTVMDRAWFESLRARGYDFSLHPDLPPPTGATWRAKVAAHRAYFSERLGAEPSSSIRNHCIAWTGYLSGTRAQESLGFTWDGNYFTAPAAGRCYMTRAGLPMELVTPGGEATRTYQLACQFSDETVLAAGKMAFSLNLQAGEAVSLVTRLMEENRTRHHSMMTINSHPVSFSTYSQPLWEPVLAFARDRGVPVLSVSALSRFWESRRACRLRPVRAGESPAAVPGQTVAWPLGEGESAPAGATTRTMLGRRYACVASG